MTAEGHFLFSIACSICAKNTGLTSILAQGDWWHIISSSTLACFLPDIDQPTSLLGRRLKWISRPVYKIFKHRGFTHSPMIVSVFIMLVCFCKSAGYQSFQSDAIQGMILGYTSHIIADMLTPAGIPLLWPCRWRFCLPIIIQKKGNQFERIFCITFLFLSIFLPRILIENAICSTVYTMSNSLKMQFNSLINW